MKVLRVLRIIARVILALTGGTLAGGATVSLLARGCTGPALAPAAPLAAVVAPTLLWETGRVRRVVDDDTYDVLMSGQLVRLRLLNVDAPEHDQAFGAQATDSVRALLGGQLVRVRRWRKDLYGRTLGNLVLPARPAGAAVAVDSVLVVRGWAWALAAPRRLVVRVAQQKQAQAWGRGLWKCGAVEPVPPKVWRGFNQQAKRRYGVSCTW